MNHTNKDLLRDETKDSLTNAQKRLDRYENLLIGHISDAVTHYRKEVEGLRCIYQALISDINVDEQLDQATDQIKDGISVTFGGQEEGEEWEEGEEEDDGLPQIFYNNGSSPLPGF